MIVNRRAALKHFLIITAGVTLLPSCMQEKSKASIILKNMDVSAEQEQTLDLLAQTIIPTTDTPGAKETSAHLFALKMLDDLHTKEDQDKFLNGLKAFNKLSEKKFDKEFSKLTDEQRTQLVAGIDGKKDVSDEVTFFYSKMRGLTLQAYLTSKYYLTKVQVYELVPSRFKGCVPVNPSNEKAISI